MDHTIAKKKIADLDAQIAALHGDAARASALVDACAEASAAAREAERKAEGAERLARELRNAVCAARDKAIELRAMLADATK